MHAGETQRGEHEFALGEHLVAARERLVIERAHARDLTHGRALAGSRKQMLSKALIFMTSPTVIIASLPVPAAFQAS